MSAAIIWRWCKEESSFQLSKRLAHGHKTNQADVGINDVMFSPDGKIIATGGQDGNAVCSVHVCIHSCVWVCNVYCVWL